MNKPLENLQPNRIARIDVNIIVPVSSNEVSLLLQYHSRPVHLCIDLTIRLRARVFYEQTVNEAQPSWLSLVENEGE